MRTRRIYYPVFVASLFLLTASTTFAAQGAYDDQIAAFLLWAGAVLSGFGGVLLLVYVGCLWRNIERLPLPNVWSGLFVALSITGSVLVLTRHL